MIPFPLRARAAAALATGAGLTAAALVAAAPAQATGPSLTAPTTGAAGAIVPFSGGGWPAYASVNVYLVGTGQNFVCSVHADSAGTIPSQTCALPTFLIAGSYTVHGDDAHGDTANAAAPLVLTPTATLTSTFNSNPTFHVAAGSTVGLGGHGFAPSSLITVKIGTTTVTTTPAAPTTDSNGTFSGVVFTVPANQAAGVIQIKTSDALANTSTSALQVYRATISAKSSAAAGSPLIVSGTGYPGNEAVNVYVGRSGSNNFMCTVRSDDSGSIPQQSCTTPSYLPQGAASLVMSDAAVTVSKPFTMLPSLVANSSFNSQPTPSVAAGSTLILGGHGYAASSPLTVKLGSKVLTTTPASPATDGNGSFANVVANIPSKTAAGKATLTVTDGASNTATVKLSVFKAKVGAPSAAPAGSQQLITGTGWPPVDAMNVYVQTTTALSFICTVHGDVNGVITPQACTVPTFLPAGSYSWVISDSYVTASAPLTMQASIAVSNGSGQPLAGGAVGTAVTLAGFGFTATSTVSAKLGTKTLNLVPGTPATGANGSFSGVSFAVPNVAAGTYSLTVTDAGGKKASAQFTVS